jgi:GPH family glycoside/pentoside/hexuronide:cation symporter
MANNERENGPGAKKPLSRTLRLFWGVGDAGFNVMTYIEMYYFNFFLTNIASFTVGVTAIITSISSIVDLCLAPIYGGVLNGTKAMRWGRYRSWLIMIPWLLPFVYAFQFIRISDHVMLSAIVIVTASIVTHTLYNLPFVANLALINVIGKNQTEKSALSSSRATWMAVGGIAFSYLGLPLANILAGIIGETNKFGALAFCLAIFYVAGCFAHFKMAKEYEPAETEGTKITQKYKINIKDMFASLLKSPQLIMLMAADLTENVTRYLTAAAAIFYWTYVMNRAELQTAYIIVSNVATILGSFTLRYVAKRLSSRAIYIIRSTVVAACSVLIYFVYANLPLVFVLLIVVFYFTGLSVGVEPVLYSEVAVYTEWKIGKDPSGWIMGLKVLPIKASIFVKNILLAASLAAVGFSSQMDPAAVTLTVKRGIAAAFALIPGLLSIMTLLLIVFGYKLTKEKVRQYQNEIDERARLGV